MSLLLVVRVAEPWSFLSIVAAVALGIVIVLGLVVALRRLAGR